MFCRNCGRKLEDGEKCNCLNTQNPNPAPAVQPTAAPQPAVPPQAPAAGSTESQKKNSTAKLILLIVGIVLGLSLIVGGVIFAVYKVFSNSTATSHSTTRRDDDEDVDDEDDDEDEKEPMRARELRSAATTLYNAITVSYVDLDSLDQLPSDAKDCVISSDKVYQISEESAKTILDLTEKYYEDVTDLNFVALIQNYQCVDIEVANDWDSTNVGTYFTTYFGDETYTLRQFYDYACGQIDLATTTTAETTTTTTIATTTASSAETATTEALATSATTAEDEPFQMEVPVGAESGDAYLGFFDGNYWGQYWGSTELDGTLNLCWNAGVAHINGNGTYQVSVTCDTASVRAYALGDSEFDLTLTGLSYASVRIKNGETVCPNAVITVNTVTVDNQSIAVTGKSSTFTEDGEVCADIYNPWSSNTKDRIIDPSVIGDWKTITVTFTVSGL